MHPLRVFALLAARVPPFAPMSAGGGTSRPDIDAAHAAALCAGMATHPYHAGLARAHCPGAINWVRYELHMRAMELSQQRWRHEKAWVRHAEAIKAHTTRPASIVLADLVMGELIRPSDWGTAAARAEHVGVSDLVWSRYVKPRHAAVGAILDGWLAEADRHIIMAQRERDEFMAAGS